MKFSTKGMTSDQVMAKLSALDKAEREKMPKKGSRKKFGRRWFTLVTHKTKKSEANHLAANLRYIKSFDGTRSKNKLVRVTFGRPGLYYVWTANP